MSMTDEERILWAEELDARFASIHDYVAESMSTKQLEHGGFEELKTDILGILFTLNAEFDLNIRSDAFWSVEVGPREDGIVHVEILPQAIVDAMKRGECFKIVEHEQSTTSRRYTAGLNSIACQNDSHFQAMVTLAQFLETKSLNTVQTMLGLKKGLLN